MSQWLGWPNRRVAAPPPPRAKNCLNLCFPTIFVIPEVCCDIRASLGRPNYVCVNKRVRTTQLRLQYTSGVAWGYAGLGGPARPCAAAWSSPQYIPMQYTCARGVASLCPCLLLWWSDSPSRPPTPVVTADARSNLQETMGGATSDVFANPCSEGHPGFTVPMDVLVSNRRSLRQRWLYSPNKT